MYIKVIYINIRKIKYYIDSYTSKYFPLNANLLKMLLKNGLQFQLFEEDIYKVQNFIQVCYQPTKNVSQLYTEEMSQKGRHLTKVSGILNNKLRI